LRVAEVANRHIDTGKNLLVRLVMHFTCVGCWPVKPKSH